MATRPRQYGDPNDPRRTTNGSRQALPSRGGRASAPMAPGTFNVSRGGRASAPRGIIPPIPMDYIPNRPSPAALPVFNGGSPAAPRQTPRGVLDRQEPRNPGMPNAAPAEAPIAPFSFGGEEPTLEEFLSQAEALFAGQRSGIDNRRAALEANRTRATGSIDAATAALAAKLAESRGQLDSRYTQGIEEAAAANQGTVGALGAQHASTQAQMAELAKNLGIDMVDNSRAASDTAFAQGSVAELGTARDTEQRGRQLTSYGLNTANIDASRMRGVETLAGFERGFQDKLAALMDEADQVSNQSRSAAMSMYGDAQSKRDRDRDFAYQEWVRQQENGRSDAQRQIDFENELALAQASQRPPEAPELSAQDQLYADLDRYGVSDDKAAQWMSRLYNNMDRVTGPNVADPRSAATALFRSARPEAQGAILQYLINTGIIPKG